MSTLTMSAPNPHMSFHKELSWQEPRLCDSSYRSTNEPGRVALPSIRLAVPELQLCVPQETGNKPSPISSSPTNGPSGTMTPPEYLCSPNHSKRRRLSFEDEREGERTSQIPRLYTSPTAITSQDTSPSTESSAQEIWTHSTRLSPRLGKGHAPSVPSTASTDNRPDRRVTLPGLPQMNLERSTDQAPRVGNHASDVYTREQLRGAGPQHYVSSTEFRHTSYEYGYHHPTRVQSLSLGSIHSFDRSPFSNGPYGQYFADPYGRIGELGVGIGGDNKQRKRRGNLPKETTDKLRAWFMAHLHHPYPTEDEKQDLMRQTGLQMNQISNWFINARRRQLPTMINNARIESDAMSGRGGNSGIGAQGCEGAKILQSTERGEFEQRSKKGSVSLSDGDVSAADDADFDTMSRRGHHSGGMIAHMRSASAI